ncbi:MAG: universal stress protein, partial [Pseudomonadota bacterium]|nr:universal stress protein [Pseudomonadota bacterium]
AYLDSMHYPDRGKLANETGLDAEHIHVKPGYTDEVVSAMAKELGADIVVMGTLGQTGKSRTRRGNTAERVIAGLDVDVMVFN